MSITDVRVQVPPRAPGNSRQAVSFFIQSILAENGKNGLDFAFWVGELLLSLFVNNMFFLDVGSIALLQTDALI